MPRTYSSAKTDFSPLRTALASLLAPVASKSLRRRYPVFDPTPLRTPDETRGMGTVSDDQRSVYTFVGFDVGKVSRNSGEIVRFLESFHEARHKLSPHVNRARRCGHVVCADRPAQGCDSGSRDANRSSSEKRLRILPEADNSADEKSASLTIMQNSVPFRR